MVSDLPSEAELQAALWGVWKVAPADADVDRMLNDAATIGEAAAAAPGDPESAPVPSNVGPLPTFAPGGSRADRGTGK